MTDDQLRQLPNLEEMNKDELIELVEREKRAKDVLFKKRAKLGLSFETPNNRKYLGKANWDENIADIVRNNIPYLKRHDDKSIVTDKNAVTHKLIKGDNFPALLTLHPEYNNSVDIIYLDPPYNTGNKDFIYNDRYVDKEDRFRHSRWLGFMARRCLIAQEMLSDTGVIFVSIDDNEQAHLKVLMDEIFGAENFVSNVSWQRRYTRSNDAKWFSESTEYILVYAKNKNLLPPLREMREEKQFKAYKNPDKDPNGKWKSTPLHSTGPGKREYVFNNGYKFVSPEGTHIRFSEETLKNLDDNKEIYFPKKGVPSRKTYLKNVSDKMPPVDLWTSSDYGSNHTGNDDLYSLIGRAKFNNPKPVKLVKKIVSLHPNKNATVLDFFAGSGTTGHSVAELNAEDGGNRKCILVTDSGKTGNANNADMSGSKENSFDIADDITYERMRKVLTGENWANPDKAVALNQNLEMLEVDFLPKFIIRNDDGKEFIVPLTDFELTLELEGKLLDLGYEEDYVELYAQKLYNRWSSFANKEKGDLSEWD